MTLKRETTEYLLGPADPDGPLLLHELNHRIKNELTCTICAVSAKAVASDDAAVKAALLDVVDLLHDHADVHNALHMPDPAGLADAAAYLRRLCASMTRYRFNRLGVRVQFSADDVRLAGGRCWKLGLIVSELLTNVARHAQFGTREPEAQVRLNLAGGVARCQVADNGTIPEFILRGRGLTIVRGLAGSLGGRIHTSCTAEGSSLLLTFPLTDIERRAASTIRDVQAKRKRARRAGRLPAPGLDGGRPG